MSDGFDAYHKWLAIPPSEQPPNHYRLLGLGLFESDPDVIAAAADRQMSHVQTYKNGPRAELSQRLLNEIASAKLCLLKPLKKEPYDAQLRQTLAATQAGATPRVSSAPPAGDRGSTTAVAQRGTPPGPIPPPPIAAPPRIDLHDDEASRSPLGPKRILAAGGILIVLLIVAIWAVFKLGRGGDASTRNAATTSSSDSVGPGNPSTPPTPSPTSDAPVAKESSPTSAAANDSPGTTNSKSPDSSKADFVEALPPKPASSAKPADVPPSSISKPAPIDPSPKPAADASTEKPAVGADNKLPIPNQAATTAAEARLTDAFPDSAPQAVLEKSKSLTDGPLVYVALNRALKEAMTGGDVPMLVQILDELTRRFAVDAVSLRAKSYVEVRRYVTTVSSWEMLAQSALALIDEATKAGRKELAVPLAETSLQAARKANNLELIRQATLKALSLESQGRSAQAPDSSHEAK